MELVTLKCPKCGYLQEERPDCVRCGIVFSKYVALYSPEKSGVVDEQDVAHAAYPCPPEMPAAELSEIRQALRDVMRRLSDVEFERAERNLLRGEIKSLDQKWQQLFEDLKDRLQAFENSHPGSSLGQLQNELREKELVPFMEASDGRFQEVAVRLKDLGSQVTSQAYAAAERLRGLEGKIEGFAARVSELEDVKVNQASLKDQVESVWQMCESLATVPTEGAAGSPERIEAESAAFRSEVRRTLQCHSEQLAAGKAELERLRTQMQALERSVENVLSTPRPGPPPDLTEDFRLIIDGLSEVRTLMQALADKLQPATGAPGR